jgi:hypothetical protein
MARRWRWAAHRAERQIEVMRRGALDKLSKSAGAWAAGPPA